MGRWYVEGSTQACEADIKDELLAPDHGQFVVARTRPVQDFGCPEPLPFSIFPLRHSRADKRKYREWSCDKDGIVGGAFWKWSRAWRMRYLRIESRPDLEAAMPDWIRKGITREGYQLKANSKATKTDYDRVCSIAKIARDRLSARAVPQQVPEEGCAVFRMGRVGPSAAKSLR